MKCLRKVDFSRVGSEIRYFSEERLILEMSPLYSSFALRSLLAFDNSGKMSA